MLSRSSLRSVLGGARRYNSTSSSPDKTFKDVYGNFARMSAEISKTNKSTTEIHRVFVPSIRGQVTYDPFDFSVAKSVEERKSSDSRSSIKNKVQRFNDKNINLLDFYCYPAILSNFLNSSGQILHHEVTGLSPTKQRQAAKAIRRARAFGLLSSVGRDVSFAPNRGKGL